MDPLALEARKATVASINAATTVGNHKPSDFDGNGLPDFAIDANDMPVTEPGSEAPTLPARLPAAANQDGGGAAAMPPMG